jgi:hypothetical protein
MHAYGHAADDKAECSAGHQSIVGCPQELRVRAEADLTADETCDDSAEDANEG